MYTVITIGLQLPLLVLVNSKTDHQILIKFHKQIIKYEK